MVAALRLRRDCPRSPDTTNGQTNGHGGSSYQSNHNGWASQKGTKGKGKGKVTVKEKVLTKARAKEKATKEKLVVLEKEEKVKSTTSSHGIFPQYH